jgi:hypothetical protein
MISSWISVLPRRISVQPLKPHKSLFARAVAARFLARLPGRLASSVSAGRRDRLRDLAGEPLVTERRQITATNAISRL